MNFYTPAIIAVAPFPKVPGYFEGNYRLIKGLTGADSTLPLYN